MDAWSRYWKTGARRSPATISITLTGDTPPQRSLRFWKNYGPTLIYKQGEYLTLRIRRSLHETAGGVTYSPLLIRYPNRHCRRGGAGGGVGVEAEAAAGEVELPAPNSRRVGLRSRVFTARLISPSVRR